MIRAGLDTALDYLETVKLKRQQAQQKRKEAEIKRLAKERAEKVTASVKQEADKSRKNTQKVEVTNHVDTVKTPDIEKVVDAVAELSKTIVINRPKDARLIEAIKQLESAVSEIPEKIVIPEVEKTEQVEVTNLKDYKNELKEIKQAVEAIEIAPQVKVEPAKVEIPKLDLQPVIDAIQNLEQVVNIDQPAPVVNFDSESINEGLKSVKQAVNGLKFPIPNYILPFKDVNGKAVQTQLASDGSIPVTSSSSYYAIKLDDTSTANVTYVGKAAVGSSGASAVWQIQKIDESSGLVITYADGDSNFNNTWNNRTSLSYS